MKNREIGVMDYLISFIIMLLLGLLFNIVLISLDNLNVIITWVFFGISLGLIILGVMLSISKRYKRLALIFFMLGIVWFVLTTLLLCPFVITPIF